MDQLYVTDSSTSYCGLKESPEYISTMNTLRNILVKGAPASLKISVVSISLQIKDDSIIYLEGLPRMHGQLAALCHKRDKVLKIIILNNRLEF